MLRPLLQVSIKLDKAQQTVEVNERDYRNYVNVLKETTVCVPQLRAGRVPVLTSRPL